MLFRCFIPRSKRPLSGWLLLVALVTGVPLATHAQGLFGRRAKKTAPVPSAADTTAKAEPAEEDPLAAGIIDTLQLSSEALPLLGVVDKKKAEVVKKKVKYKKNVFDGIPTRKAFTKTNSNGRLTMELFSIVKIPQDPHPYVRDIHWYDPKTRAITTRAITSKEEVALLHGAYQKLVDGAVVEEGYFHLGARHGRWEKYKSDNTLVDKAKYRRGFQKEAAISYHDAERKKIKEVIPKEHGVVKGKYYRYYDGGQLAAEGNYDDGVKIGRWTEYYQFRRQRKQEMQYGKNAYDTTATPVLLHEWDENGRVTFDYEKGGKLPEPDPAAAPVKRPGKPSARPPSRKK